MPKARSDAGKSWQHLYNTSRWRSLRLAQLRREPLCAMCFDDGRIEPAAVADHIAAHKGDEAKFFDPENLQSLCLVHHNSVKQSEERTGKRIRRRGADGWPVE